MQACGLPVVFENNNINIDRASHHNGMTFLAGDVDDFRKKILYFAEMFMQALLIFHSPAIFTRSEPVEAHFLFLMKCASSMENRISYCRD